MKRSRHTKRRKAAARFGKLPHRCLRSCRPAKQPTREELAPTRRRWVLRRLAASLPRQTASLCQQAASLRRKAASLCQQAAPLRRTGCAPTRASSRYAVKQWMRRELASGDRSDRQAEPAHGEATRSRRSLGLSKRQAQAQCSGARRRLRARNRFRGDYFRKRPAAMAA